MGLQADIQAAVKNAFFSGLGDLPKPSTYYSQVAGASGMDNYDIVTGKPLANATPYTLPQTIYTKFKEDDGDNDVIVATDAKLIFTRADLPVALKTDDYATDVNGVKWVVKRVMVDAANAAAVLHVRTT